MNLNQKNVLDYFETTFNQHRPALAAERYLNTVYTHHGPHPMLGADSFVSYFESFFEKFPKFSVSVQGCMAQDDFVILYVRAKKDESDSGHTAIEVYRLKDGRIAEHWDVLPANL